MREYARLIELYNNVARKYQAKTLLYHLRIIKLNIKVAVPALNMSTAIQRKYIAIKQPTRRECIASARRQSLRSRKSKESERNTTTIESSEMRMRVVRKTIGFLRGILGTRTHIISLALLRNNIFICGQCNDDRRDLLFRVRRGHAIVKKIYNVLLLLIINK